MSFTVVIPARLASTRLPRKVLVDIAGYPMIYHTYQQAQKSGADRVVIATDNEEIYRVAVQFGAEVCMTATDHPSGSDRINEACQLLELADESVVVNVQADEPMIAPSLIAETADILKKDHDADVATLGFPIQSRDEVIDPNVVKVVVNQQGRAMYFSRAPIPWDRDGAEPEAVLRHCVRHVGIYAYRVGYLRRYVAMPPCNYETIECLEQLRVLWSGGVIGIKVLDQGGFIDVNTAEDLDKVRVLMQHKG